MDTPARRQTLLEAQIAWNGNNRARAAVQNLSDGGARLHVAAKLREGAEIFIELPGLGWVLAQTVWSNEEDHGICFADLIDANAVRRAIPVPPRQSWQTVPAGHNRASRRFV